MECALQACAVIIWSRGALRARHFLLLFSLQRQAHTSILRARMSKHLVNYGNAPTAPWKVVLQTSLAENKSLPYSKYMQLATVRPNGRPAVRTVVFRGFYEDTNLVTFVTDRRSSKIADLAANPSAELCWYFPNSREQYRLSGVIALITVDNTDQALACARQKAWEHLSAGGRTQFLWPHPGQPRMPTDESLFQQSAPESAGPAVEPFCLGVVQVHEVDYVNLYTNKRVTYSLQEASSPVAGGIEHSRNIAQQQQQQHRAAQWQQTEVNP